MKARIISDDLGRVYEIGTQSNDLIEEIVDADSNHNFWAVFRREAAKDILAGWYSNPDSSDRPFEQMAKMAIEQADELIKQLKEGQK